MCEEHVFLMDINKMINDLRKYLETFEKYWTFFEKVISLRPQLDLHI